MSSKYRDRLLQSSGVSNIRFESEYAKKLMTQMGWKEGNGLGKHQHGSTDCVQVKRRDDNLGLGKKTLGSGATDWKDEWWNDVYNNSITKFNVVPEKFKRKLKKKPQKESSSSDDSSDDSSCSSSSPGMPSLFANKQKPIKKAKKQEK